MKKSSLSIFLLGAALPFITAEATPNVTLYGAVDLGVMATKTKHSSTVVDMRSGFSYASRWGIRGVEDLGNGYSVGFILEQGLVADTGDMEKALGTRAYGRESSLNVSGPFGKLTFGRLGTLGFFQSTGILKGSVFGVSPTNSSAFNKGRGLSFGRVDNAIAYTTPSISGLTFHAMYSNKYEGDDSTKWSSNNHYYGLGAKLTRTAIDASAIFEVLDNKGLKTAAGTREKPTYHFTIGGSYDLKSFKPYAIYVYSHQENVTDLHAFALGSSVPAWGGTFKAQARVIFGRTDGTARRSNNKKSASNEQFEWTLGAGYDYPLSKRTYIWSFAGYSAATHQWKEKDSILFNGWQIGSGLVHKF